MRCICTILLLCSVSAFGQDSQKPCRAVLDTLTNLTVYRDADEMASFPGGMEALAKQVQKRVVARSMENADGAINVYVAFVVQSDGTVIGQRVVKDVDETTVAEQLLDIIDDVRWKPGMCDGHAVATIELFTHCIKLAR